VMALVLSAGPQSAASHRSAAALLELPGFRREGRPEVTTPRPRRHRNVQAMMHQSRVLPPEHLCVIDGIPCTRLTRTLVDLAAVLHPARIDRVVENCLSDRLVDLEELRVMAEALARRGRKGTSVMRDILDAREPGYVALESELEARFLALVVAAGLPEPRRQVQIGDEQSWMGRVDFAYPEARLVIELDGRRHHTGMLDRDADRARDNRLAAAGWRVVRFTWSDLTTHGDRVVALVRDLLALSNR
jgi:very-short-patch-repair endonuclease